MPILYYICLPTLAGLMILVNCPDHIDYLLEIFDLLDQVLWQMFYLIYPINNYNA